MNQKVTIITIVVILVLAIGIYMFYPKGVIDNEQTSYTDITAVEAQELMDSNPDLIVIDVSPAYAEGHLPGAVSYALGDGSLDAAIPNLDKQATYLVYCHVFSASSSGAQKLVDAGFENVYRLDGEYDAWVEAGYEIEM